MCGKKNGFLILENLFLILDLRTLILRLGNHVLDKIGSESGTLATASIVTAQCDRYNCMWPGGLLFRTTGVRESRD